MSRAAFLLALILAPWITGEPIITRLGGPTL